MSLVNSKEESKSNLNSTSTTSSTWSSSFLDLASKLSGEINQAWRGIGQSSGSGNGNNQIEKCPLCDAKFSSATSLVDHAKKVHQRNGSNRYGVKKASISACPKCSKGFLDPVSLVEHVERDHGGSS
ncbi:hypothetical protein TSUD_331010 [Trifolium subterraneum]|uniref:C2H2-type domain-containing protein n=1 Tax=Trifolium subterraneum TaxID=3900 RepID=A0A2Z6PUH7_TRISU|nr:hypothetical protein TSUD_331010 [Trifolium subterraneum]